MKTHSGAKKRFKKTGSGKYMRKKAGKAHLLTKKKVERSVNSANSLRLIILRKTVSSRCFPIRN
ncbi:MAG: 50S ribosomal protein L35 [Fodinibius sp.]|nr:50S ribosomal protein L35 [Fodinibius sp.]